MMASSKTTGKFTANALKVFEVAQREARASGRDWAGTQHLLLGLLADANSRSAHLLTRGPLNFDSAQKAVADLHSGETRSDAKLPSFDFAVSHEANAIIARAVWEASERNSEVDSVDLVGLLLDDGNCDAAHVIDAVGANISALRAVVLRESGSMKKPAVMPANMVKRPTRRCQQALDVAIAQAKSNGIGHYDSGYALLGLCTIRGGIASALLAEHDVTAENLRALISELTPSSYRTADDIVQETLPASPELNACFGTASRYATLQSSESIETEHLLLALIDDGSRAAELLDRLGIDRESMAIDLRTTMNLLD
jgi:ATP-dependent Clp protease ATP-binding subunit ClpA